MGKWKATDPRWKQIAEGRWPPHNPAQRRHSGKTTRDPSLRLGGGRFQPRPAHPLDRRRSRRYAQHRMTTLQRAVRTLGDRAIDPASPIGRALQAWRSDLLRDLGGAESVTTQQVAVVDVAVRTKLILDSVDTWLLARPTLVHHRTRSLLPVVVQRMRVARGFLQALQLLGLERRGPKTVSLGEYLSQYQPPAADPPRESDGDGDA
jgi:hypothetical protein